MYAIIKSKLAESSGMFTFNFLEDTLTLEDVDKIFNDVEYKKCLLLKGKENIIITNRSQLLDNFFGSTGLCIVVPMKL
jgi:hypothetical protein